MKTLLAIFCPKWSCYHYKVYFLLQCFSFSPFSTSWKQELIDSYHLPQCLTVWLHDTVSGKGHHQVWTPPPPSLPSLPTPPPLCSCGHEPFLQFCSKGRKRRWLRRHRHPHFRRSFISLLFSTFSYLPPPPPLCPICCPISLCVWPVVVCCRLKLRLKLCLLAKYFQLHFPNTVSVWFKLQLTPWCLNIFSIK